MNLWLFIIAAIFIQEPASTDAAIFQVRTHGINLWLINAIWLAATAVDIALGYAIGKWVQKRFAESRLIKASERWADRIADFIGRAGERLAIILIGVINFPYLNAFIFSWLKLRFRTLFILIFIGDAIYWAIEWAINIGVRSVITDSHTALYVVVALGLVLSVISKVILNKVLKKPERI